MPTRFRPKYKRSASGKAFKGVARTESPNEDKYRTSGLWTKASRDFRAGKRCIRYNNNPRCNGKAETTDHRINPALDKSVDFWDRSNWQPMCRSCHAIKSNQERAKHKKR